MPRMTKHEVAETRRVEDARALVVNFLGERAAEERAAEIAALPCVDWRGRTLRTVRCNGTTGKGPHDYNVPESVLWHFRDIQRFVCPYHM